VERPRSLILIGDSRTGKTEWARSLGKAIAKKHIYFANFFDLQGWSDDFAYGIMDDFVSLPTSWKFFLGAQKEGILTDKYRKKRRVRNGKPWIWICNADGDFSRTISRTQLEWVRANCLIYELTGPLYE